MRPSGEGHVAAAIEADTAGASDKHYMIALRPQLARYRGFLMTYRKLSAPISNARRMAVSTIAATLLSATGISVDMAVAQQPPTAPRPGTPPRPATPAPAAPAGQKPGAPAAQKPPAPGAAQAATPGA